MRFGKLPFPDYVTDRLPSLPRNRFDPRSGPESADDLITTIKYCAENAAAGQDVRQLRTQIEDVIKTAAESIYAKTLLPDAATERKPGKPLPEIGWTEKTVVPFASVAHAAAFYDRIFDQHHDQGLTADICAGRVAGLVKIAVSAGCLGTATDFMLAIAGLSTLRHPAEPAIYAELLARTLANCDKKGEYLLAGAALAVEKHGTLSKKPIVIDKHSPSVAVELGAPYAGLLFANWVHNDGLCFFLDKTAGSTDIRGLTEKIGKDLQSAQAYERERALALLPAVSEAFHKIDAFDPAGNAFPLRARDANKIVWNNFIHATPAIQNLAKPARPGKRDSKKPLNFAVLKV